MYLTTLALAVAKEPPLVDIDNTVFIQLGIFIITAVGLTQFLFKPYLRMRAQREVGIEGARDEAKRMDEQARLSIQDYEDKIAKARVKSFDERAKLRAEAVAREREIVDATRAETQKVLETARTQLASDAAATRKELEPRTQEIARVITKKILGREIA